MPSRKTLYIHIGRPKAASTAIQRFLDTNRGLLLRDGVLYPRSCVFEGPVPDVSMAGGSHRLSLVFLRAFAPAAMLGSAGVDEVYAALDDEIQRSPVGKAVVSSEAFWLIHPAQLPQDVLRRYDVRILCYLRRQDEVLISSFAQEVKDGGEDPFQDWGEYLNDETRMRLLDYAAVLDDWAGVFGRDNIRVRVLERGQLHGGEVCADFLSCIGLEMTPEYAPADGRPNPSPPRDMLSFLGMLRAQSDSVFDYIELARVLENNLSRLGADERFRAGTLLDVAQREAILRTFDQSNRRVARDYLGREDDPLFLEPVEAAAGGGGYPGLDIERMSWMIAALLTAQHREANEAQRQIHGHAGRLDGHAGRLDEQAGRLWELEGKTAFAEREKWRLEEAIRQLEQKVDVLIQDLMRRKRWRRAIGTRLSRLRKRFRRAG